MTQTRQHNSDHCLLTRGQCLMGFPFVWVCIGSRYGIGVCMVEWYGNAGRDVVIIDFPFL